MRCNSKKPNVVKDELLQDSGAFDTFCNDKSLFTTYGEIDAPVSGFIAASRVKGRVTIGFDVHDDQGQFKIIKTRALHVPDGNKSHLALKGTSRIVNRSLGRITLASS